jgi:hypothetical protein
VEREADRAPDARRTASDPRSTSDGAAGPPTSAARLRGDAPSTNARLLRDVAPFTSALPRANDAQGASSRCSMRIALPRRILRIVSASRPAVSSRATSFVCGHVESVWG